MYDDQEAQIQLEAVDAKHRKLVEWDSEAQVCEQGDT